MAGWKKENEPGWLQALAEQAEDAPGRIVFWLVALVVGCMAGYAAIGFRLAIDLLLTFFTAHRRKPFIPMRPISTHG